MDFGKIRSTRAAARPKDPIRIFESLPSLDGAPNDLWRGQAEALRRWDEARDKSDVVVSLTTGAGKTVVGLLIAQSLVNEGLRNVVYLCSTNDLVTQTSDEANKIGIEHTTRIAGRWSNDLFETEKGFCITNYHALFNGHSLIARRHRPEAIIFDDAHVAESVMRGAFTLTITLKDHPDLYRSISSLFADHFVDLSIRRRYEQAAGYGSGEMVMAAPRGMIERAARLSQVLAEHIDRQSNLSFAYAHLADHLAACTLVISDGIIEIAPPFVPALTLRGFQSDVRRVYLSATLQSQVEFVRAFGRKPSIVIEPENDAGNGERLILDGRSVDGGFGPNFVRTLTKTRKAVVAVPSYGRAERWSKLAQPPRPESFTNELNGFRVATNGTFILVSRADGIDLPADTCRVMVMEGVPTGASLLERMQYERLEMQAAQDRRIAGRITQLFGRINRGRNDYGVFFIEGKELAVWLARDRSVALLPPLLRKQVVVGRNVQEDMGIKGPTEALEITEAVLNRDTGWVDFYREEVRGAELDEDAVTRAEEDEDALVKSALAEALYAQAMWEGDFPRARRALEDVAVLTETVDTRLSGWHEVCIAATHDAENDEVAANDHYAAARRRLPDYLKLPQRAPTLQNIGRDTKSEPFVEYIGSLTEPSEAAAYEKKMQKVREELSWIDTGSPRQAEAGVRLLGELLGFRATRPDNDDVGTGPDVAWEATQSNEIVGFELKTGKVVETASYKKSDIGQGHDHIQWLADNYHGHQILGLLYVGPDGPVEAKANPSDSMRLCTIDQMAALRDRWLALVADVRAATPASRPEKLAREAESGEWSLSRLIGGLGRPFKVTD
ncbi:MAG: DEAD/DEAH box helicase family protein [Paracoccus sp. (in: a-proteobacteria)]